MKNSLAVVIFLCLFGCSHVYVSNWNEREVTTCCPHGKILCTHSTMDELAAQRCGGSATPIAGGTVESGARAIYGNGYASASVTRDTCVRYSCKTTETSATNQTAAEEQKKKVEEICNNEVFKAYYAKSPCKSNEVSLEQLNDKSKIKPDEKVVLLKLEPVVTQNLRDSADAYRTKGAKGVEVANVYDRLISTAQENNLNLYNHKISWGEYNRVRRDFGLKFRDEINQIIQRK